VATAARIRTGDHVLDVACGTGVPALEVTITTEAGAARFPSIRFMARPTFADGCR
jgi:hypothetical protein